MSRSQELEKILELQRGGYVVMNGQRFSVEDAQGKFTERAFAELSRQGREFTGGIENLPLIVNFMSEETLLPYSILEKTSEGRYDLRYP